MRHPDYDGAEEYEATKAHLKERTVGHTPGPWEPIVVGVDTFRLYWQTDDVRRVVLVAAPDPNGGFVDPENMRAQFLAVAHCGDHDDGGESEANARLIAASPTMRHALKEVKIALGAMEDMDHVQRMEWFETTGLDLHSTVREALEKAEGDR